MDVKQEQDICDLLQEYDKTEPEIDSNETKQTKFCPRKTQTYKNEQGNEIGDVFNPFQSETTEQFTDLGIKKEIIECDMPKIEQLDLPIKNDQETVSETMQIFPKTIKEELEENSSVKVVDIKQEASEYIQVKTESEVNELLTSHCDLPTLKIENDNYYPDPEYSGLEYISKPLKGTAEVVLKKKKRSTCQNMEPDVLIDMEPKCFLCGNSGNIKTFNNNSFTKCQVSLRIRIKHQLGHENVVLPENGDLSIGYHSRPCYSNFNAINARYREPQLQHTLQDNSAQDLTELEKSQNSSQAEQTPDDNQDVYIERVESNNELLAPRTCIFCKKKYKRVKGRPYKLSYSADAKLFENIKEFATKVNDYNVLNEINTYACSNNSIPYHNICRINYHGKEIAGNRQKTDWHDLRDHYESAFKQLCLFVKDYIIDKGNCCFVEFIEDLYLEFLSQSYGDPSVNKSMFSSRHIPQRLVNKYKKHIRFEGKTIIQPCKMSVVPSPTEIKDRDLLQRAALLLRQYIRNIEYSKLDNNMSTEDLLLGECKFPEHLTSFFTTLLAAFDYRRRKSAKTTRLVQSFSSDVVFAVTNGEIKPSKQITLGIALKSLCNSKNIVKIIHRYGHICSYDTLQDIETEATCTIANKDTCCPSEVHQKKGLHTVCVFDNSVGIVIQDTESKEPVKEQHTTTNDTDETMTDSTDLENALRNTETTETINKKRSYEGLVQDMPRYSKKIKMMDTVLPNDSVLRSVVPADLNKFINLDLLWVMSHFYGVETPMWEGFNSKVVHDKIVTQKVSYITPINESPTDSSVILETIRHAQSIAKECDEPYVQVSYDLGIGKISFPLKSTEKNVFIHFGTFHNQMAFFKGVGSFIDGCGLTNVLVEASLIGTGYVATFLSGKHFNRCKRLHILCMLCLQMQEFKYFLEKKNIKVDESVHEYLQTLQKKPLHNLLINNEIIDEILLEFKGFKEEVLTGIHGKTQQFYGMYIQFIEYYLLLERSVRMSDLELLCYVLPKITNIFFTFNQTNYARWLVWYHSALLNIDATHPGLKNDLVIGVKRTEKLFSRIPLDLTINTDATRRLTDIMDLTDSISTRKNLNITHGIRSAIISHVLFDCGLEKRQDVTNDLLRNRIKKSLIQREAFITALNAHMNPFSDRVRPEMLCNISTGQAAPVEVANFLLNAEHLGQKQRMEMIEKCSEDEESFKNYVIKRNRMLNFATCIKPKKIEIGGKIQEVKLQRDLFGRLLGICLDAKVDMTKILQYPLTPVPLSLCHLDGTIIKTVKSTLTVALERQVEHGVPENVDVYLVDGFFLLHNMKQIPMTYRQISMKILRHIINACPTAKAIYLVFDTYKNPSLKEAEYGFRNTFSRDYCITGPEQNRPENFAVELQNISFKEALVSFLMEHWSTDEVANEFGDKEIYVSFDKCYRYTASNGIVFLRNMNDYKCEGHEDAVTKFAFYVGKLHGFSNVVISCADTDILIIILGNMHKFDQSMKIWLQFGTENNQRFINASELHNKLGHKLCTSLPAFHAFTGCEYNPAFNGKGKNMALHLLMQNEKYQTAFTDMSDPEKLNEARIIVEDFVCKMYATRINGLKGICSVDEARLQLIFSMNYSMMDNMETFKRKVLKFDASLLPPCTRELEQHMLRTLYISNLWANATLAVPSILDFQNYGWVKTDRLEFKWFEGPEMPELATDIIIQPQEEEGGINNESYHSECDEDLEDDDDDSDNDVDDDAKDNNDDGGEDT